MHLSYSLINILKESLLRNAAKSTMETTTSYPAVSNNEFGRHRCCRTHHRVIYNLKSKKNQSFKHETTAALRLDRYKKKNDVLSTCSNHPI